MLRATLATAALLVAGDAVASGQDFLGYCKEALTLIEGKRGENTVQAGHCVGYVKGVNQTVNLWLMGDGASGPNICFPEESSLEQLIRVWVRYLEDHPESLHQHELYLILIAFKKAFPCDDG